MAKVVAVYNKERRRDHRRAVKMAAILKGFDARIKGVMVTIRDISPGGVGLTGEEPDLSDFNDMDVILNQAGEKIDLSTLDLKVGDITTLEILLTTDEPFVIDVEIRRADNASGNLGARFVNIGNRAFSTLEKIVLGRIR
ncbi:PilZ domain-containing protein [Kiloniella laminariae]|uniref:PilZ domain-containing protein n=1 Tax=Kiloniella laminariae TaxID=454162 RepID=A0ABT4LNL6_9PROT|nr:PilZ domain-containing protein [Kiloniella laminariae]MCZ4282740.1 PilZ domain-containing protein [Kiloniella laminariae]